MAKVAFSSMPHQGFGCGYTTSLSSTYYTYSSDNAYDLAIVRGFQNYCSCNWRFIDIETTSFRQFINIGLCESFMFVFICARSWVRFVWWQRFSCQNLEWCPHGNSRRSGHIRSRCAQKKDNKSSNGPVFHFQTTVFFTHVFFTRVFFAHLFSHV